MIEQIVDKRFTRVEIIEKNAGRTYSNWGVNDIEWSIQDSGKTLKIFINYHEETQQPPVIIDKGGV